MKDWKEIFKDKTRKPCEALQKWLQRDEKGRGPCGEVWCKDKQQRPCLARWLKRLLIFKTRSVQAVRVDNMISRRKRRQKQKEGTKKGGSSLRPGMEWIKLRRSSSQLLTQAGLMASQTAINKALWVCPGREEVPRLKCAPFMRPRCH